MNVLHEPTIALSWGGEFDSYHGIRMYALLQGKLSAGAFENYDAISKAYAIFPCVEVEKVGLQYHSLRQRRSPVFADVR